MPSTGLTGRHNRKVVSVDVVRSTAVKTREGPIGIAATSGPCTIKLVVHGRLGEGEPLVRRMTRPEAEKLASALLNSVQALLPYAEREAWESLDPAQQWVAAKGLEDENRYLREKLAELGCEPHKEVQKDDPLADLPGPQANVIQAS